jgi:hypothetical protein
MKKRAISFLLVISVLLSTLNTGILTLNASAEKVDLKLLKAENLTGNFNELRITFSTPVRFEKEDVSSFIIASGGSSSN